jgi:chromosomal replication initiator protein
MSERVPAARIIAMVAAEFNTTEEAIKSDRRDRATVLARYVTIWLLAQMTNLNYSAIAKMIGDRDHSTILYAMRKIGYRIQLEHDLGQRVLNLQQAIYAARPNG